MGGGRVDFNKLGLVHRSLLEGFVGFHVGWEGARVAAAKEGLEHTVHVARAPKRTGCRGKYILGTRTGRVSVSDGR